MTQIFEVGNQKLTVACILTSLMLLCSPVLACGTQLNPLPCEPSAGLRQTDGQFIFAPRFRPVPSPRAHARSNRRTKLHDGVAQLARSNTP